MDLTQVLNVLPQKPKDIKAELHVDSLTLGNKFTVYNPVNTEHAPTCSCVSDLKHYLQACMHILFTGKLLFEWSIETVIYVIIIASIRKNTGATGDSDEIVTARRRKKSKTVEK